MATAPLKLSSPLTGDVPVPLTGANAIGDSAYGVKVAFTFNWEFEPVHTLAGVAVVLTIAGGVNMATLITAGTDVQPFAVAVKVYPPAAAAVAAGMVGLSSVLVKPFGPDQA